MDRFFQSLRNGNYRRTEDALFGGVCAGLAHHWRIAPILVRIAFLLLLCMGGMTFLIYGFAWILIPRDQDQKIELEQALRGNPSASTAGAIAFMMLGSFSIFVSSAGLFGLLGESVQELFYLHIFLVTAPIVFVMILLVLAHSFYYRKVAANSAPAALDPDFIKQHQFETSSQQNHENATPDFSSGDSFSAHLQQQKMDDKTTHQEFTAQMPRSQMTVLDHNAVPNFSPYYESRVDFGSDYAERSPHISGRFALITISVILVLIALALAFLPHTYGSWAIMAGIISACLGVAVLIAGIRGLRATWLTFFTWIAAVPTVPAIFFALLLPHEVTLNEDTQVFAKNFTDVSSVKSQQNSAALFDFTHRVINDHTPSGDVQLAAGAAGSMKFKVPDDQAVIFKIKGIGVITLYSLQEWNVQHQDILTSTQLPDFIDGNSEAIIRPAMQDLFLRSGETLTLTSPAARKNPQQARTIEVIFGFGGVLIESTAPDGQELADYVRSLIHHTSERLTQQVPAP